MLDMRRREFITLLGGAAVCCPRAIRAQSSSKCLIGNLFAASMTSAAPQIDAILEGLRDLAYVQGRDFEMQHYPAEGILERLPTLAAELMLHKPDVILANPTPAIPLVERESEKPTRAFCIWIGYSRRFWHGNRRHRRLALAATHNENSNGPSPNGGPKLHHRSLRRARRRTALMAAVLVCILAIARHQNALAGLRGGLGCGTGTH